MIIAFANHKGGVGKTTSVATVGYILSQMGKKVLLLDLDPQSNLTTSLLPEEPQSTIYDVFVKDRDLPIIEVSKNLYLVPSDLNHAGTALSIAGKMQRECILKKAIQKVSSDYDFIFFDCPPALDLITINALTAADELYIPITAEILPTKGLSMLTNFVGMIQQGGLNEGLKIGGIFFTKWENTKLSKAIEQTIKETFGPVVFAQRIRKNISVSSAPAYYKTVVETDPQSNGSVDYIELANEILKRNSNE